MRVAFFGTPAFALPTLAALIEAGHAIVAAYTRAPKPGGRRGLTLTPSPVHAFAEVRGVPVHTPATLRDPAAQAAFGALAADVAVVVAYGLILPPPVLAAPRHGCFNLHPSLLPRWRGAAPIQRPIIAGDGDTAAAVMRMEEGLDTGPVALEERVPIAPDATAGDMHDLLAARGARLMVEALDRLAAGTLVFRPQSAEGIVYARKIDKAEARIDWTQPAGRVHDLIRGLSPAPGAWFEADLGRGPERIKVLRSAYRKSDSLGFIGDDPGLAGSPGCVVGQSPNCPAGLFVKCGSHHLELLQLQRSGKSVVSAKEFLLGTKVPPGTVLS